MKRFTLSLSILFASLAMCAQENDSLQREVTIVRDFTPIVRDADKINTLPPVSSPVFNQRQVKYSYDAISSEVSTHASSVNIPYPGSDSIVRNSQRGYFNFDMGSYLAIAANAGYRILDTKHDHLNVAAQFTSFNWDIPVNSHTLQTPPADTRQTFYDIRAGLGYAHIFDNNLTFSLRGAYRYIDFNYYGAMGTPGALGAHPFQHVNNFFAEAQVDNSEAHSYDYEMWRVVGGYKQYANANALYSASPSYEHHAYLRGAYSRLLDNDWRIGGEIDANYLQYSGLLGSINPVATADTRHIVMARLLPYVEWNKGRMSFRGGVKIDISAGDGAVFRFAPDIHFNWEFVENYFLFANINGGKRLHTWSEMSQHCLYSDPSMRIPSTYSPLDGQLGVRMKVIPELSVTLYGGYEAAFGALFQHVDSAAQALQWRSLDATCLKAGVRFDANITQYVTLTAYAAYRHWQHDGQSISYNRPRWEANARATAHPNEQFDIALEYAMQLGRDFGSMGKLNDIHNLQALVKYRPNDWLSISLHGNNLLNIRYDYYYGMPAPGIQIMGGVGLKF